MTWRLPSCIFSHTCELSLKDLAVSVAWALGDSESESADQYFQCTLLLTSECFLTYFVRLPQCPRCRKEYPSIEAVIQHLNSQPSCWPAKTPSTQGFTVPPGQTSTRQYHPNYGHIYGIGKNMLDQLDEDEYAGPRKENPYYPFEDEGEWDLGRFLVENLNQTQINKFLKLKWVSVTHESMHPSPHTKSDSTFHSSTPARNHHLLQKISF